MKFCPKCGSMLLPRKDGKCATMACPSCKYVDKTAVKVPIPKIADTSSKANDIPIVFEGTEDKALPTTDAKCEKCGNGIAYYWLIQTRAGDEPETKFLKCTKCKHIWRDYS